MEKGLWTIISKTNQKEVWIAHSRERDYDWGGWSYQDLDFVGTEIEEDDDDEYGMITGITICPKTERYWWLLD